MAWYVGNKVASSVTKQLLTSMLTDTAGITISYSSVALVPLVWAKHSGLLETTLLLVPATVAKDS